MSDSWTDWQKGQRGAGDNQIAIISGLVDDLAEKQAIVAQIEQQLKDAKAEERELREVTIPERMEDMELEEITTKSGVRVAVEEKISASPKKDDRERAWDWLEANNHGALIKREAIFSFGRGEEEAAIQMIKDSPRPGVFQRGVHASTLSAFVREQLAEGVEIPMELLGVRRVRQAKIKVPKD